MSYEKGIQRRKERIEKLKQMLTNNPNEPLKKILARFCVETGVDLRTAQKYYRLLVQAEAVKPHPQH